jgi:hypothetical protein
MDSEAQIATTLICPICGKSGTALWGGGGSALDDATERKLVSVSSGFERGQETDQSGDAEITCTTCSVSVPN